MLTVEPDLYGAYQVTLSDGVLRTTAYNVLDTLDGIAGVYELHNERRSLLPPFVLPGEVTPDISTGSSHRAGLTAGNEQGATTQPASCQLDLFARRANADRVGAAGSDTAGGVRPPVTNRGGKVAW